jgi:hypothetical protein
VAHAGVVGLLGEHDDELIAAEAPDRVGAAHDALQAFGDGLESDVAGAVAQAVVDQLEVVEVDEHHRDSCP